MLANKMPPPQRYLDKVEVYTTDGPSDCEYKGFVSERGCVERQDLLMQDLRFFLDL